MKKLDKVNGVWVLSCKSHDWLCKVLWGVWKGGGATDFRQMKKFYYAWAIWGEFNVI